MFTPEFRNRLDAMVAFAPLPPEVIRQVVEKFVLQLEAQLADRDVTIELTDEAADWLAENGYDETFGARPLARVIQEHIKKPLADELLFGKLEHGGTVRVLVEGEGGEQKLTFVYIRCRKPKPKAKAKGGDEDDNGEEEEDEGRRWSRPPRARRSPAPTIRRTGPRAPAPYPASRGGRCVGPAGPCVRRQRRRASIS